MSKEPLREITCSTCGAPVPLAAESPTSCAHCGRAVELPVFHVELHRKMLAGAAHLAQADALWRALPPPMPRWVEPAFMGATVVGVTTLVVSWASTLGHHGMEPGRAFALFVLAPTFVALQLGLELLAWWSPFARLEQRFSASQDSRFPEVARCRICGAPITVSPQAVLTRCAYCGSDNLVRRLTSATFRRARETAEQGRQQIDEAIANLRTLGQQRAFVRWLGPGIMIPLYGLLLFVLWR
jgi:DNA-directed RNA polymerase subunit RPC12/RpoP